MRVRLFAYVRACVHYVRNFAEKKIPYLLINCMNVMNTLIN